MVMEAQELKLAVIKNKTFIHKEKGHKYKIKEFVKSKHPDTGVWYNAILYIQLESSELFVRSEESFVKNFIIIN